MAISNPVEVPSDGDRGDTFFDQLETWGARINSHLHDGADAERINIRETTRSLSIYKDITVTSFPHTIDITTEVNASKLGQSPNTAQLDARTAVIQVRSRETKDIGDGSIINYDPIDIKFSTPNQNTIKLWSDVDFAKYYPSNLDLRVIILGV